MTIYVILCSTETNLFAWEAHYDRADAVTRIIELEKKNLDARFSLMKTKLIGETYDRAD